MAPYGPRALRARALHIILYVVANLFWGIKIPLHNKNPVFGKLAVSVFGHFLVVACRL